MLPENFHYVKYGLQCKLITEEDASFILSLRSDPRRTQYMLTLPPYIDLQKKWIREYKERERMGLDYCFIYNNEEGKPIGINRIAHINYKDKTGVASGLITIPNELHYGIKIKAIRFFIIFNILGLDTIFLEVHKKNERAINIEKLFGGKFIDTSTDFFKVRYEWDRYFRDGKGKILKNLLSTK